MLFGRRRFNSPIMFAPAEDAPEGGGGSPPPKVDVPPPPPPPKVNPPAKVVPDFRDPAYIEHLTKVSDEVAKRVEAATETRIREKIADEQKRKEQSEAENLRQDLANERRALTNAQKLAEEQRAENAFLKNLNLAGLVPQDEDSQAMAWDAAKRMAGEGKPVTSEVLADLAAKKTWLFKSTAAAAGAAPAGGAAGAGAAAPPGSNPAAVTAAGTLSTQPAPSAAGAGAAAGAKKDARSMTPAEFAAWQAARGVVVTR